MAIICNAERARFGVMSGHDRKTLSLSGLAVSFERRDEIANQTASFLPVGWLWLAGAPTVASVCEMVDAGGPEDEAEQPVKHKHKMPEDD